MFERSTAEAVETKAEVAEAATPPASLRRAVRGREATAPTAAAGTSSSTAAPTVSQSLPPHQMGSLGTLPHHLLRSIIGYIPFAEFPQFAGTNKRMSGSLATAGKGFWQCIADCVLSTSSATRASRLLHTLPVAVLRMLSETPAQLTTVLKMLDLGAPSHDGGGGYDMVGAEYRIAEYPFAKGGRSCWAGQERYSNTLMGSLDGEYVAAQQDCDASWKRSVQICGPPPTSPPPSSRLVSRCALGRCSCHPWLSGSKAILLQHWGW